MKVLVTGRGGQLASEFESINKENSNWTFVGISDLDITDKDAVKTYFENHWFDVVINCSAYTAVDKAEDEVDICNDVNHTGVKHLILSCAKHNIKLIHYSTDYVFDGNSELPYKETDPTNPIGVYGKTKRAGEKVIENSLVESIIIRTSWVYSAYGNNFVKTIIRLGNQLDSLGVVADQYGSPTYAKDLAYFTIGILKSENYTWLKGGEYFHFSNQGQCSWFDFAKKIFEIEGISVKIYPLDTSDYPTKAKRPKYSILDKSKTENVFGISIPSWDKSLELMLNNVS